MIFYELVSKNQVIGAFTNIKKAQKAMAQVAPGLKPFIRQRGSK